MEPNKVLFHAFVTEKCMDQTDRENKMTFIVNMKSNKNEIREAVEKLYKVKVDSVRTMITQKGKKKAIVRLSPKHNAADIIANMGVV